MAERCNQLDGPGWVRNSISLWSDIRLTKEEKKLAHPAKFPQALVERLIDCFTNDTDRVVFDPFVGSGSTLAAAYAKGKYGCGIEIARSYYDLARQRMLDVGARSPLHYDIANLDAKQTADFWQGLAWSRKRQVDLAVTSPPYWSIMSRKRTADLKETRDYAETGELGNLCAIDDYNDYLAALLDIFAEVHKVLRPGGYFVVNVMDLRVGPKLYTLHSDLMHGMTAGYLNAEHGLQFTFDDLWIWDRRQDYNNLRALGYPYRMLANRCHEYLLVFRKPKAPTAQSSVRKGNTLCDVGTGTKKPS